MMAGISRDERWRVYLDSLLQTEDSFLLSLRLECEKEGIPIIRRETEYFLRWLFAYAKPLRVLEIGTAAGYSSIFMAKLAAEVHIITIEKNERLAKRAKNNIQKAGLSDRISVITGDAAEEIKSLHESFDLVFLDGPKGQYIRMIGGLLRLLPVEGLLLSDNVLQEGNTLESRFTVKRRDRTIHKRIREFLYEITHMKELCTDILPVGDGLAVSVRIEGLS